jgi:hypothetical protein
MRKISLLCATAALATPVAVYAQQITTGIEGTVTDEAGAPLTGAEVTITDTRTNSSRTITTGSGGSFNATGLTTGGPYTVAVTAPGFEGQTIENVTTSLQGNTSLTFQLTSGAGEIVVTGSRVALTTTAATASPSTAFRRATFTASTTPAFPRAARPRFPMTRSAKPRFSSRRLTLNMASSPDAPSTS